MTDSTPPRKRSGIAGKLSTAGVALGFFLILKYQHTPASDAAWKFLLNPGPEHALPQQWQDYRELVLVGVLLLLVFAYKRTWRRYREAAHILGEHTKLQSKPPVSVVHAGYYFQQERSRCLLAWIMKLCDEGALTLHYIKGRYPWAIGRESDADVGEIDHQRLDHLFVAGDPVVLKPWASEPHTELRALAYDIYEATEKETAGATKKRQSCGLAVLALIAFFAEIPFYTASLSGDNPAVIAIAIMGVALTALPVYGFTFVYSLLFTESKRIAQIILIGACVFATLGIAIVFYGPRFSAIYFGAVLLPGLAAALAILVRKQPALPRDEVLLSKVVGFRSHLAMDGYQTTEEDLPWTMAMSVHSGMNAEGFYYRPHEFPRWLRTDETDVQEIMKRMHRSMDQALSEAISGKHRTRSHGSTRSGTHRF